MPERFKCQRCKQIIDFDEEDYVRVNWGFEHVRCPVQQPDEAASENAPE